MHVLEHIKGYKNIHSANSDILYSLSHMPSTAEQFEKLKKPFLKGVNNWIEMMRLFQGTDSVAFAKDNHVDTEPEWDNAISFTMTIKTLMQKMLQWCSIDQDTMKVPYLSPCSYLIIFRRS